MSLSKGLGGCSTRRPPHISRVWVEAPKGPLGQKDVWKRESERATEAVLAATEVGAVVSIASPGEEEGELIEPALECFYLLGLSFADIHTSSSPPRSPARHTILGGFGVEGKGGATMAAGHRKASWESAELGQDLDKNK